MATKKKAKPVGPYCYALVDPAGEVFYIGKGVRGRMFAHENDARKGVTGAKCDRIRQILADGDEIEYRVLGTYETDAEALDAERAFIASHVGLTNLTAGGEGGGLPPKERIRRQAMRLLRHLKPLHPWAENLSETHKAALIEVAGSPEAWYEMLWNSLARDIADPIPNMITVHPDGTSTLGWY